LLAQETGAKRFLEVGTGIGYTTALMAEAGGQDAKVDTIELDSTHADITESELERKALSGRVSVLRGDARKIVRTLAQPYDVVFADSGADSDIMPHLRRLTRSGGVSPHIKGLLRVPLIELLAELRATLERGTQDESLVIDRARDRYRQIVKTALETTWNQQAQS
jgi:protein-L-isoaspartate O-methyltransferase